MTTSGRRCVKHPLFDSYETVMWEGILIKRMNRYAIRFNSGCQAHGV